MRQLIILFTILTISNLISAQSSRVSIEVEAADGPERNQLDIINTSDGSLSASVQRFITGTTTNLVESGFRNFPLSYTGVDNYGGYFTISNNAKGIIFRTESSDADMRFLLGGFPIDQHQKMILDKDGNLGIGVPDPVSKVQVKGGDIYLEDIEGGVIMRSQDQSCWRLTVSNGGDPVFTKVDPCPN